MSRQFMFNNIQMLRAVAAAMVFFYHAGAHYQALGGGLHFFSQFASIGFSDVDIFFRPPDTSRETAQAAWA